MRVASPVDLLRAAGVEPASPASEAFLLAAAGAKPTPEALALWPSISPMPWPSTPPKIIVRNTGRGSFKTTDACDMTLFHALAVPHDRHALPGTRIVHAVVAPVKKQAAAAVNMLRARLDQLAPLGIRYTLRDGHGDTTEITIVEPEQACQRVISVHALDATSPRGFAFASLHLLEAAHAPTGPQRSNTIEALWSAIAPRLAQFPLAQAILESTNGPPQGMFYEWCTKPPPGALRVQGATFKFNPAISEAEARIWCPNERTFRQEILCELWGHSGDSFLDPEAVERTIDGKREWTALGPRRGHFVLGVDLAQLRDRSAFVVVSACDIDPGGGHAPVRHFVVEHIEQHQGAKNSPLMIEALAARQETIARMFPWPGGGPCGIIFDQHLAVENSARLRAVGYTEIGNVEAVRSKRYFQAPMHVAAQTARWRLLREVVDGGRLHLPDTEGQELASQLRSLVAWEQAGGLKVEGKRDDLADALVLALEAVSWLPPTGGDGAVQLRSDGFVFNDDGVFPVNSRWVRRTPDGREIACEWPRWDRGFDAYARRQLADGRSTRAIDRWHLEKFGRLPRIGEDFGQDDDDTSITIPVLR